MPGRRAHLHRRVHLQPQPHGGRLRDHPPAKEEPAPLCALQRPGSRRAGGRPGASRRIEIAYAGTGRFAPTCIRFRKAVETNRILFEDYSNYQMTLRFLAGAMGVPFLPTRSSLGTDIVNRWGFSKEMRQADPRLPNQKLMVMENPFGDWTDTERVVLVPAIRPDVTLIHVQQAAADGTARIAGLTFADVEQAKAARHVVVTCEELVGHDALRPIPSTTRSRQSLSMPWCPSPTAPTRRPAIATTTTIRRF